MYYTSGAVELGISDHNLIYTVRNKYKEETDTSYIWTRSYRKYDKDLFRRDLERICWDFILNINTLDLAAEKLMSTLTWIIDKYAPYKWIKCKGQRAKWVTHEFLGLIDAREYHIKRCRKTPLIVNKRNKQDAIRAVNNMKLRLQRDYIDEAIEQGKGNSKEIWKRLKQVCPLKNKSTKIVEFNGKHDNADMAEEMNKYFANIEDKLANDIPHIEWEQLRNIYPPMFSFTDILTSKVQELINGLNCSKACGLDGVTARLIKDAGPKFTPVLTYIFNLSLQSKQFPSDWKPSLKSPIYKDGDHTSPANYRPIALLSIFSKMLEHVVHEQLSAHLRHINFFNKAESGFRKGTPPPRV